VVDVVNDNGKLHNLINNCRRMRGKALHIGGRNVVGVTKAGDQRCGGLEW